MRPAHIRIVAVGLAVTTAAACGDKRGAANTDSTGGGATGAASATTTAASIPAPDGSYDLQIPARWAGIYRIDSLSSAERGGARPGALNIVYLPRDTTALPQSLVVVAVYDSAAWQRTKAEGGPPPGDSLLSRGGRVYILGMPQSNPFAPGSLDALKFDSLALSPAEKADLVRPRN